MNEVDINELISSKPEILLRLDDPTAIALEDYARRKYPKPNGGGNRTEAARQILTTVFEVETNPAVKKILDENFALGGDVCNFIRGLVDLYFNKRIEAEGGLEVLTPDE